jgi:hypothetical protein
MMIATTMLPTADTTAKDEMMTGVAPARRNDKSCQGLKRSNSRSCSSFPRGPTRHIQTLQGPLNKPSTGHFGGVPAEIDEDDTIAPGRVAEDCLWQCMRLL